MISAKARARRPRSRLARRHSMTEPIRLEHLSECAAWWGGPEGGGREEGDRALKVTIYDVRERGFNLDIKNPHVVSDEPGKTGGAVGGTHRRRDYRGPPEGRVEIHSGRRPTAMNNFIISDYVIGRLRAAHSSMLEDVGIQEIIAAKDQVIARYGPAFQPGRIEEIEEKVLGSFLYIENNRHWSGLQRQVNRICADMAKTRNALASLVNENQSLSSRMQPAAEIKGMGKGIITAILHVAYPEKYGVWNNTSDEALAELEIYPKFARGATFGDRYEAINEILKALADAIQVDLWTLDALWWHLWSNDEAKEDEDDGPVLAKKSGKASNDKIAKFSLERHLHDYMFDNWDSLELAKDWEIYSRDGEPDAGYELKIPVGRIDLLAKHKSQPRWLVIELKREKSSDSVVGQVLRYMGWIQRHLIEEGDTVEGLVVATEGDSQLHYALEVVPNLSFMAYEVQFSLTNAPTFEEFQMP